MALRKKMKQKQARRKRIHFRIRHDIYGTPERPRLSVFRSNNYIYAQVIDDTAGHTLAAASSKEDDVDSQKQTKTEQSFEAGKNLAKRAQDQGIEKVVFDRGGYLYHGRVKALADGAREGGLQF